MDASVLEANFVRRTREIVLERLNDIANKDVAYFILPQDSTPLGMKNPSVGMSGQFGKQVE